nr:MBL fold metallo-hydrolase [Rubellimicrobium sp. CFH 75288]
MTILGCGSSGGVPRIGADGAPLWGACDPANPLNRRRRCSALVTRGGPGGATRVLIDTSPDLRAQLLDAGVGLLDGVFYTHAHADHVHGIDDLRLVVHNSGGRLPVWADEPTARALRERFGYAFETPPGSDYPPICELRALGGPVTVEGRGGPLTFRPFAVEHGSVRALGFRIGNLAYLPDVSEIPDGAWSVLEGIDCFVVDALRYRPHPTHAHLERTLGWIDRVGARRAVITNMHVDLDHTELAGRLPPGVIPAHDGLQIPFEP